MSCMFSYFFLHDNTGWEKTPAQGHPACLPSLHSVPWAVRFLLFNFPLASVCCGRFPGVFCHYTVYLYACVCATLDARNGNNTAMDVGE